MASGKKGKKTKGKTLALTDFLQETPGTVPAQPIRKSNNINWAEEVEDYDGYDSRKPLNVVLPTAPKASREYEDYSDKVPRDPPYRAYLSNLPYDVDEEEIMLFFNNLKIASLRIPKDDRDSSKLKGYGYVEFEDRDSLLDALAIPDTTIKNRRIRIEVSANTDDRRRGRMDIGRDRIDRGESTGDWRSGPRTEVSNGDRKSGFGRDRDRDVGNITRDGMRGEREERNFSRDNMRGDREEKSFSRDNMRGDRDDRGFSRDNMRDRDSGFNRDRDSREFRRDRDGSDDKPGAWREGERFNRDQDRGFSREKGGFRDSDRMGRFDDKDDRKGFGRRFDDRDRGSRTGDSTSSSEPRERPKLVLAPRTKPVENVSVKAESVPSASIFGNAKPVDTAQREREIEERLAKEQSGGLRETSRDRTSQDTEETEKKPVERGRITRKPDDSPPQKDDEKKLLRSEFKSPEKTSDNKHKTDKPMKEEKRERHEKEMPKIAEPEPPNFAASNKFAFLQTDDVSD